MEIGFLLCVDLGAEQGSVFIGLELEFVGLVSCLGLRVGIGIGELSLKSAD